MRIGITMEDSGLMFEILRHGNGAKREDVVEREGSVVLFVSEVSSDQLLTLASANYLSSQPELPATKQLPCVPPLSAIIVVSARQHAPASPHTVAAPPSGRLDAA